MTAAFVKPASLMARSHGYPELARVVIPHPFLNLPRKEVLRIAEESFPDLMAALIEKPAEQSVSARGRA